MALSDRAKSYLARYALPTGSRQDETEGYTLIRELLCQKTALQRWKEAEQQRQEPSASNDLLTRLAAATKELEDIALQWPEGETAIKGDLCYEDIWPHLDTALDYLGAIEREIEKAG